MQESGEDNFLCPSFNNFGCIAEIAAKVSDEFKAEEEENSLNGGDGDGEEDFEFSLVCENPEFINNGQNKFQQIFPVFNRDLFDQDKVDTSSIHIPLKNLFLDERELASDSESEVYDLETIPEGTYCVWKPKINETSSNSPIKCKKSKSTGSVSKKWKLRDLLRRSNSEGKDSSFVFLTPKKAVKNEKDSNKNFVSLTQKKSTGKVKDSAEVVKVAGKLKSPAMAAHQALYGRNYRMGNEVDKNRRRSYLPYRQDLIGFFSSVNGVSRMFRPF